MCDNKPVVVLLVEEAPERREAAVEQQLQIADLTLREAELLEQLGFLFQFGDEGLVIRNQLAQASAVRGLGYDCSGGHGGVILLDADEESFLAEGLRDWGGPA
mgnify:CR=1 FL=1